MLGVLAGCGTTYGIYHRVSEGETLYSIGRTYGLDYSEIQRINRLEHDIIFPGQEVFIPGAERQRYVSGSRNDAPPPADGERTAQRRAPPPPPPKAEERKSTPAPKPTETARIQPTKPPGGAKAQDGKFIWPVKGGVLYSRFGSRNGLAHDGIDISAAEGTPIVAVMAGRVIYSGDEVAGYGNLIIIRHEGPYATVYAHNRENLVKKDDFVNAGQTIATVGQTGRVTGPHLHFELRKDSKPIDPSSYFSPDHLASSR